MSILIILLRLVQGPQRPRMKVKKMALLMGYSGTGYQGMQLQRGGQRTIEGDLFSALIKADMVPVDALDSPFKVGFQRTARTDKGVHAARQVRG